MIELLKLHYYSRFIRKGIIHAQNQDEYPKWCVKNKAIFIHIPKAAGSSIISSGVEEVYGHVGYTWYMDRNKKYFDEFHKFTIVRNPWDRLVSAYSYLSHGNANAMDKLWAKKNIKRMSFDEFIRTWLTEENAKSWIHFIPQADFIYSNDNQLMMDYVGRFESLSEDFKAISKKLSLPSELQKINPSQRDNYQTYYSTKTRDIVQRVYKRDIDLLEYEF